MTRSHLDRLESESIYVLREAQARLERLGMLWSIGKDSTVLLWLARKAFFGKIPFPLIHIDTSYKIPEMIQFRDRVAKDWQLPLVIGRNEQALAASAPGGPMNPGRGRVECCSALKTTALQQAIAKHGFRGIFLGIRRDEEGTRAKERIFSPRSKDFEWNFKEQPPELWDHFRTDYPADLHVRIHPLLNWTELNVWEYIEREAIPVIDLYFAKGGKRYRSLGCAPCTAPIASNAATVAEIIAELRTTRTDERAGRAQDQAETYAMQKLRLKGYM